LVESTRVNTTVDSLDFFFGDGLFTLNSGNGGWVNLKCNVDFGGSGVVVELERV
jgi:hypothetical protein